MITEFLANAIPCLTGPLVALDLETTTMNVQSARIVELTLASLNPDLSVRHAFTQLINPGIPIPSTATALHGIGDLHVRDQPTFREVAGRVQAFLKEATLIAYNGRRFDIPLLHRSLRQAGQPGIPTPTVIDPYLLFTQDAPRTLTAACQFYLGQPHPHAHESNADVSAMLNVLRMQVQRRRLGTDHADVTPSQNLNRGTHYD